MAWQRHVLDQLMLSLFDKEASYDAGPAAWANANACSLLEFDDASAHEEWDDEQAYNEDVATREFPNKSEIVRQSVRLTYTESRAKPNSLAGLMALALGSVTSAQDAALIAYRHSLSPAAANALPSIGAQVKRENGRQYKYTGIKSDSYTLSYNNQGYLQLVVPLIGSGSRATAADAFAASISESWLRWGDAKLFVKDTAGTAISIPATPAQGSSNLGGGNVDLSSRVLDFSHVFTNGLNAALGYRAGGGKVRKNLHPAKRSATVTLRLEADDTTEAAELDYYLNHASLALELNLDSGSVIAGGGVFKFGLILIIPLLSLTSLPRTHEAEREVLTMEGRVKDDGTNPVVRAYVYNAQSTYLA